MQHGTFSSADRLSQGVIAWPQVRRIPMKTSKNPQKRTISENRRLRRAIRPHPPPAWTPSGAPAPAQRLDTDPSLHVSSQGSLLRLKLNVYTSLMLDRVDRHARIDLDAALCCTNGPLGVWAELKTGIAIAGLPVAPTGARAHRFHGGGRPSLHAPPPPACGEASWGVGTPP